MKSDKIEVSSGGYKAVAQANSSPAFYVCIFVFIVGLWSVLTGEKWPFIVLVFAVGASFVWLLFNRPQNLMDSKTLLEWTKSFMGSKDNPNAIMEGDIVKTESISAKASITKKK